MGKSSSVLFTLFLLIVPTGIIWAEVMDPNLIREAQMIAVDLKPDELLPDEDLTEEILDDLMVIRRTYPAFADISYFPSAAPDEIIVVLTDSAAQQYADGEYDAWEALNQAYGIIDIRGRKTVFVLKFDRVYNTAKLAGIYNAADLEGVKYAEQNGIIGDGSTIVADPPDYTFIRKWGDCPSGCTYEDSWTFTVYNSIGAVLKGHGEQTFNSHTIKNVDIKVNTNRDTGYGSFRVTGKLDVTFDIHDKLADSENVYVRVGPYDEMLSLESGSDSNGSRPKVIWRGNRLIYTGTRGNITRAVFDLYYRTFEIEAKNVGLTGLSTLIPINIGFDDYAGSGSGYMTGETPIEFLYSYADTLRLDNIVIRKSPSANRDMLWVTGDIAVEDALPDLTSDDMEISWGEQMFTLPAGSFTEMKTGVFVCTNAPLAESGRAKARFDFNNCKFRIRLNNISLNSDQNKFRLSFADFDMDANDWEVLSVRPDPLMKSNRVEIESNMFISESDSIYSTRNLSQIRRLVREIRRCPFDENVYDCAITPFGTIHFYHNDELIDSVEVHTCGFFYYQNHRFRDRDDFLTQFVESFLGEYSYGI